MQKKGLNDNSDTLSYTKHKGHPQAGVENVKISSNFYHYGDEESLLQFGVQCWQGRHLLTTYYRQFEN